MLSKPAIRRLGLPLLISLGVSMVLREKLQPSLGIKVGSTGRIVAEERVQELAWNLALCMMDMKM